MHPFLLAWPLAWGPSEPPPPQGENAVDELTIGQRADRMAIPDESLPPSYEPPFPSEPLKLSEVLQEAAKNNLELGLRAYDLDITEANILQAVGAFDVFLNAGLNGSLQTVPQRGSQINISRGARALGGNIGFTRRLETGGNVTLSFNTNRAITQQSSNPFDPTSSTTGIYTYRVAMSLQVTHPLLRNAGLRVTQAPIRSARIAQSRAEATQQQQAQTVARDLIAAYWNVLFAHRDLINKRKSQAVAEQQLDKTRQEVRVGRLAPIDVKAIEQALATREGDTLTAENSLLDTSVTLRAFLGQDLAERDLLGVLPETSPQIVMRPVVIREEIQRALRANPQIRQLELDLASRRIDALVAANQRLPQLDVAGNFGPQGTSIDLLPNAQTGAPGQDGSWRQAFRNVFTKDPGSGRVLADWSVSGALTLVWDVQNRGPRGGHQAAQLQVQRAELQLRQMRQQVTTDVIRVSNKVRTAQKQIDVQKLAYELAQQNLVAEQARFAAGRSTNFDVLQRLSEMDAAAARALRAQIDYLQTLVELQALNGEILPAYGLTAPRSPGAEGPNPG